VGDDRRAVHEIPALDHGALVVDADQIGRAELVETHAERIHPERVGELRVTHGDTACDAFGESEPAEQSKPRSELRLAISALVGDRIELRRRRDPHVHGYRSDQGVDNAGGKSCHVPNHS